MMTTNLFVIANVQQLRTGGSFRILLAFFQTSWGVGVLNWAIFNSFHNRVEFGTISEGLRIFEGGGFEPRKLSPPPGYATGSGVCCRWFLYKFLSNGIYLHCWSAIGSPKVAVTVMLLTDWLQV